MTSRTKRHLTSDLKELLERHKNRVLFMTRDTNETVILYTSDLVDCMKGDFRDEL